MTISQRGEADDGGNNNSGDHQHRDETENNVENTEKYSANHYDDPKLGRKAHLDLEMNPGEDCGMFYGLEVLDASQYRVEQCGSSKRLVINGSDDTDATTGARTRTRTETKPESGKETDKSSSSSADAGAGADTKDSKKKASETNASAEPDKKKRKKKQKDKTKNKTETSDEGGDGDAATGEVPPKSSLEEQERPNAVTPEQLSRIQASWSRSTGGAHLHDALLESLHRLGFHSPTPIQAATLSASTMGRRNLVGAAPTGSGKTLAFLLPILNNMLQNRAVAEAEAANEDNGNDNSDASSVAPKKLQALIMTPTRGKYERKQYDTHQYNTKSQSKCMHCIAYHRQ